MKKRVILACGRTSLDREVRIIGHGFPVTTALLKVEFGNRVPDFYSPFVTRLLLTLLD